MRRGLVFVVLGSLLLLALPAAAVAVPVDRQRLAGVDRFATAAVISEAAFSDGADTALLARGDVFADALAAGALAGELQAPVLLSRSGGVPDATLAALDALGVSEVTILGGTQAVGRAVEQQLQDAGLTVDRVAGANRYATAAEIAGGVGAEQIGRVDGRRTALLASGVNFPDALAAGALAYAARLPILLTPPDRLATETAAAIADLGVEQVLVLGGPAAVSDAVQAALEVPSQRLAGADRTRTAAAVADFAVTTLGFTNAEVVLARGDAFPDALASAPYAGGRTSPVLLTQSTTTLGGGARDYLAAAGEAVEVLTALGGTVAIAEIVHAEAARTVRGLEELIVFVDGWPEGDLYTIRPDGTARTRLTTLGDSGSPAWSPDGTRIAFTRSAETSSGWESAIWVMNADGSGQELLTENGRYPAWTPEEDQIAFSRAVGGEASAGALFVMEADGTNQTQLTEPDEQRPAIQVTPAWSPDGDRIAFTDWGFSNPHVYSVASDGSDLQLLNEYGFDPAWSPDQSTIAFARFLRLCAGALWVMDPDGGNARELVKDPGDCDIGAPGYSPDGAHIVFAAEPMHPLDPRLPEGIEPLPAGLHVVDTDGSDRRFLTAGSQPDWWYRPLD